MSTPATRFATEIPKQVVLRSPIVIDRPRVFVDPPTIHIGYGDSKLKVIEWVNQTGGDVLIWLPNGHNYLNGEPEDFLAPFTVSKGGRLAREVRGDCKDGDYEYNVYCKAIGGYAEGNSPPIVHCP
jgi:hypothetical protein